MAQELGGRVERTAGVASSAAPTLAVAIRRASSSHGLPAGQVVWMSHATRSSRPRPGLASSPASPSTPDRGLRGPGAALYGVQFHPEVVHTEHGAEILKNFLYRVCRLPAALDAGLRDRGRGRAHPRAGRSGARALRALGRRRLGRRGAARPQGGRRPADVRLRRPRPPAQGRGAQVRRDVRRHFRVPPRPRRRARALPRAGWRASRTRRRSAGASARSSSASSRRRPAGSPDARFLVQGTLYSGRDRVRRERATSPRRSSPTTTSAACPSEIDFELVEPLRMLFKDEVRSVGEELGPAGGDGLAPSLPRARARDPDHRRGHRGAARDPARGRRDHPRGGSPRRPLPRALAVLRRAPGRSARSASRATSAPTRTRSWSAPSPPRTR